MIFNLDTKLNFYHYVVDYLHKEGGSSTVIVPNDNLARNLKEYLIETVVLKQASYQLDTIAEIYKLLSKKHGFYSINAANAIFQAAKNGKALDNTYFDYDVLQIYQGYVSLQKEIIDKIFQDNVKIAVVGFFELDDVTSYLFEKAIDSNQTIFVQGLYLDSATNEDHFLYKLQKFFSDKNVISIQNGRNSAIEISPQFNRKIDNVIKCKNDYEQLTEAVRIISDLYPNVVLVTKNEKLLQKITYNLKLRNINIFYQKDFTQRLDTLFLFYILDLYLYPNSGEFLLQLIKHPYIYKDSKSIVDELEKNYIRSIEKNSGLALLKKIMNSLKLFDNTANFAQAHLKIAENFFDVDRDILEYISEKLGNIKDLQEYINILRFFAKQHQQYPKERVNALKPEDASFILEDNVVLVDCTEENLDFKNVAYNLYQIIDGKNAFFLYNEHSRVSRIVLRLNDCRKDRELNPTNSFYRKKDRADEFRISTELLPKLLTATMIESLINNPYEFYLRYILKVKEVKPIDPKPGYLEFGNLVHSVLQHCTKKAISADFLIDLFDNAAKQYYKEFIYTKTLWLPRFSKMAEDFARFHNERLDKIDYIENEASYSINIHSVQIMSRMDRIEYSGAVAIIDFKTGSIPSIKDVESFVKPQLLIQALILKELKKVEISELMYYKFDVNKPTIRRIKNLDNLLPKFRLALEKLIEDYLAGLVNFGEVKQ